MRLLCLFLVLAASAVPAGADIIHVPGDQPTIQAGIDAALPGDVVLVAPGTYTGPGNKDLDLWSKNIEIRSEGGAAVTIIDCEGAGRAFYLHGLVEAATVIDGFTIRNGDGAGGDAAGGGMLISGASPTILNCVFTDNTAANGGGGIACHSSSSAISNCVFTRNSATDPLTAGGGIAAYESSITVAGCTFAHNSAPGGEGGGMFYSFVGAKAALPAPVVSSSTFTANHASLGGGMSANGSGTVIGCTFRDNSASIAGGIAGGFNTISGCSFFGNTASQSAGGLELTGCVVSDCTVSGNSAVSKGGGMWCASPPSTVTGCIVTGNSAAEGGGIAIGGAWSTFTNCTVVGNVAPAGSGVSFRFGITATLSKTIIAFGAGQAVVCGNGVTAVVSCCDVYGNAGGDWAGCIAGQLGVNGNIAEDPLFCDRPTGDLSLCSDSPCAPGQAGACQLIGALPVGCAGCGTTAVEPATWGEIKFRFGR